MSRSTRASLIRKIERSRNSQLITYVTNTRQHMDVSMSMDCIRKIYDHLQANGKKQRNIDLFLHSNGGDGTVPWRLVTLIREYSKKFSVLIPHRAFSAATLTALGADSVIMHPMGMLGPTDPTVTNAFNPTDSAGNRLGISSEDVTAYIALIKDDAGIQHEDELVQAFNLLAEKVHPLALGNVKRFLSQSRMMAKKLLSLHMDATKDAHKIDEIVDNFTSKLFYHGHPINRKEAKDQIGLVTVTDAPVEMEKNMWELFKEYELEMRMEEPFNPTQEFLLEFPTLAPADPKHAAPAPSISKVKTCPLVFVESASFGDVSELEYELSGQRDASGATSVLMLQKSQSWKRI